MKNALKFTAIIFTAIFIGIQFFRPDFTNPPVIQAEKIQVPENINAILKRSCFDCHSNETVYPWYANVQPSAWFLKDHIDSGRRELNFSVWNTFDPGKKSRKLEEICEQVKMRLMPLPSYLWIHTNAKLSDEEIEILCKWTEEISK